MPTNSIYYRIIENVGPGYIILPGIYLTEKEAINEIKKLKGKFRIAEYYNSGWKPGLLRILN